MGKILHRVWQRAVWSWAGWRHVWRTEASLSQWLVANAVFAVLAFALPLGWTERALVLMGGIVVLAMECLNTAIERVVDDASPAWRERARQAKDAGSAAVAVTAVGVGVAWVCILIGLWAGG